jgi:hypothetical protein
MTMRKFIGFVGAAAWLVACGCGDKFAWGFGGVMGNAGCVDVRFSFEARDSVS